MILASGRAILASVPETGTAQKAVQQSGGGVVVAPEDSQALADAVEDLYLHPAKVYALGEQGRNYAVENYGFEEALNHYEALFAAVAASHGEKILAPLPK